MKRPKFSEEQIAYAIRQAEAGTPHRRSLPTARGECRHVLCLEEEAHPLGRKRAAATPAAGGRKRSLETAGDRPLARQTPTVVGPAKKSLRPARYRELAA